MKLDRTIAVLAAVAAVAAAAAKCEHVASGFTAAMQQPLPEQLNCAPSGDQESNQTSAMSNVVGKRPWSEKWPGVRFECADFGNVIFAPNGQQSRNRKFNALIEDGVVRKAEDLSLFRHNVTGDRSVREDFVEDPGQGERCAVVAERLQLDNQWVAEVRKGHSKLMGTPYWVPNELLQLKEPDQAPESRLEKREDPRGNQTRVDGKNERDTHSIYRVDAMGLKYRGREHGAWLWEGRNVGNRHSTLGFEGTS